MTRRHLLKGAAGFLGLLAAPGVAGYEGVLEFRATFGINPGCKGLTWAPPCEAQPADWSSFA